MFYADLHIHSKYSRATSKDCDLEHLCLWGAKKGLSVISCGDFTHPKWFLEIQEKLEYLGNGIFKLKDEIKKEVFKQYPNLKAPYFVLSVEISTIYKDMDKTRKVHHVVFCPDIESASKFRNKLDSIGNINSDGRPILGLKSRDLLEITLNCNEDSYIIPAHIWTPWFSVLGSKSGYDFIEDCYKDLSKYIFALETGLSSDPYMNWRVSRLDRYRLVSNSDAHSPSKLAREATIFNCDIDYFSMKKALKEGTGYYGTVEFFPEEGKYHADGHRKCGVCLDSIETKKLNGICPICHKPLTIGVSYRVEELADRYGSFTPPATKGEVISLIPLNEILSEIMNVGSASKKVEEEYERLIQKFGSELSILTDVSLDEIEKDSPVLSKALLRLRKNEVIKTPGYDGEYGVIKLFKEDEIAKNFMNMKLNLALAPSKKEVKTYDTKEFEIIKPKEKATIKYELDEFQKSAIEDESKALIITAGPGSGKTAVLTQKIAYLISKKGVNPKNCLAITFTKKACNEMQKRLEKILKDSSKDINIHTFHSLCFKILKEKGQIIGINPDFKIITKEEKQFYKESDKSILDFDDLILKTLELLSFSKDIQDELKKEFQYIFIDEYQDIDENQYKLIKFLTAHDSNICIIGDPNQSIYGFRGASSKYFNNFCNDFQNAKKIHLKNNYRSTKNIVDFSNQVIEKDEIISKNNKNLDKITIHKAPTTKAEAEFTVSTIEKLIGGDSFFSMDSSRACGYDNKENYSWGDFAILYRTQNQLPDLIEALERSSMPYEILSNNLLIEQKEIKDFLHKLKDEDIKSQITNLKGKIKDSVYDYLMNLSLNINNKEDFIHEVSFLTVCDTFDKRADRISLMTLHSSKGLEYKCVFIMGLEEGILPFYLAKNKDEIEEEKRLFYVGLTRAQERLFLSRSKKRLIKGEIKEQIQSRFLDKIEKDLLNFSEFQKEFKKEDKILQLKLF